MKFAVSIFSFLALSSINAVALSESKEWFSYFVRVPAESENCETVATRLEKGFRSLPKVDKVSHECKEPVHVISGDQKFQLFPIVINYRAAQEMVPYSAYFGKPSGGTLPYKAVGIFPNYSACLKELEPQQVLFEKYTGLKAFLAVCQPGTAFVNDDYVLRIDGFGEPKRTLRLFDPKFSGDVSVEVQSELESIFAAAKTYVVYRKGSGLFYYGQNDLSIAHHEFWKFEGKEMCESQLSVANQILKNAGSVKNSAHCLKRTSKPGMQYSLEAVSLGASFVLTDYGNFSEKYFSMEECISDRARALKKVSSSGRKVLGGICHRAETLSASAWFSLSTYYLYWGRK